MKINCCMAAISAFRVTQHSQIFSLFFRNRIQCIVLYQLYNSQALLNLHRDYIRFPKIESSCSKNVNSEIQTVLKKKDFDWMDITENVTSHIRHRTLERRPNQRCGINCCKFKGKTEGSQKSHNSSTLGSRRFKDFSSLFEIW